ncbi:hypothetical protein GCM10011309_25100 [Litorimonas cladophorae]|uniref:Uncharacterized protein n=1 Tax=Litorimonas cladophorae TaxID=1220491 RepID=A0A918KS95_9PROT|nr:hypothetical protein GCM10011309_25100 [Litorimonas cladophorae]
MDVTINRQININSILLIFDKFGTPTRNVTRLKAWTIAMHITQNTPSRPREIAADKAAVNFIFLSCMSIALP